MRDGKTRKLAAPASSNRFGEFLSRHRARVVVVAGGDVGVQFPLQRERLTLGRGPGVDIAFDDTAMSRQHAAIEYTADGFRVLDLGSTNGVRLRGKPVSAAEIRSGDRFDVGGLTFELVIEEQEPAPEVFELPAEL